MSNHKYKDAYREMIFGERSVEELPIVNEDGAMGAQAGITPDGAMQAGGISDDPDMKTNVMNVGRKNVIGATQRRSMAGKPGPCTCNPKKKNCNKCKPQQATVEGIDPETGSKDPATKTLAEGSKNFNFTESEVDYLVSLVDAQIKAAHYEEYYEDDNILNSLKAKLEQMEDKDIDELSEKLESLFDLKVRKNDGKYLVFQENGKDQYFTMKFRSGDTDNESIVEMEPVNEKVCYTIKMSNQTSLRKIVEFIKKKLNDEVC